MYRPADQGIGCPIRPGERRDRPDGDDGEDPGGGEDPGREGPRGGVPALVLPRVLAGDTGWMSSRSGGPSATRTQGGRRAAVAAPRGSRAAPPTPGRRAHPAALPSLGVGDPGGWADLRPGETVLDLGSGPGRDVLHAAGLVGPSGRAIGVDATPEMVFRARGSARGRGIRNAEFRLGEIEHLPVESGCVDVVLSDCVVNLSPDKAAVFRGAVRVLRPGGRVVLSDVVAEAELPPSVRGDARAWAGGVAGAVSEATYLELLRGTGFQDVRTVRKGGTFTGLVSTTLLTA